MTNSHYATPCLRAQSRALLRQKFTIRPHTVGQPDSKCAFLKWKIRRHYLSAPLPARLWNFVSCASQKGIQVQIGFIDNQR
jgi:hypothetical protein